MHRNRSQVAVVAEDGKVQLNKNVVNGSEPFLRLIGGLPSGTPVAFEARVACRADPGHGPSAAVVLGEPLIAVTAVGTVNVPGVASRRRDLTAG